MMPATRIWALAAAAALMAGGLAAQAPAPPQFKTTRTDLQRHDLSIPGREVLQARVDFAPGVFAPMHTHPGEEIIYVIEGALEYEVKGSAPVTLKTGDVLFVPAGIAHSARNVGSGRAAELGTFLVEKGKPLAALAP